MIPFIQRIIFYVLFMLAGGLIAALAGMSNLPAMWTPHPVLVIALIGAVLIGVRRHDFALTLAVGIVVALAALWFFPELQHMKPPLPS